MPAAGRIGVFDSGVGGLTVLAALRKALPQYSYVYYADQANAPYGERSAEEIYDLTAAAIDRLVTHFGCALVILACNTASAAALRRLQREWLPEHAPDAKVLGLLVPSIEQIVGTAAVSGERTHPPFESVGILATTATVQSGAYNREIRARRSTTRVVQVACPELASLIERGAADQDIADSVQDYLRQLQRLCATAIGTRWPEAVLLGCTHYSLVKEAVRQNLPSSVALFDQPSVVARATVEYLQHHAEIERSLVRRGELLLVSTRSVAQLADRYKKIT